MVLAFVQLLDSSFIWFNQNIAKIKINRLTADEKYGESHALKKQCRKWKIRYTFHCPTTKNGI